MESDHDTVALFTVSRDGVRLVARTSDPSIVGAVREHLVADCRRELMRLDGGSPRLVEPDDGGSAPPGPPSGR